MRSLRHDHADPVSNHGGQPVFDDLAERTDADLGRWAVAAHGGHFAARATRAFFRDLR